MKKIFDWTVGSFFRTIGRAIAFFAMATLVYYLLSYNDIDFGINNLFFEKVDALALNGHITRNAQIFNNKQLITLNNDNQKTNTINFTYTPTTSTDDYVTFSIAGWQYMQSDIDENNLFNSIYTSVVPYIGITLKTTGAWEQCEIQSNQIVCPIPANKDITGFEFSLGPIPTYTDAYFEIQFYILEFANYYQTETNAIIDNQNQNTQDIINSQNQNTQAITNQTQQQQQQHQETMNSSTTDAENDASSFFGNFTVEDQGGLSAIVTAPLNTIRSLLSSTCADLVLPLPFVEEDLTLPCMYSIYTEHFGAFFSLYQTIILGIIAYRCIMSIFFDIKGFTNPNDDRIEVMDL